MKTDSIFYRLFLEYPDSFFELLGLDKDLVSNYEFSSREIKQVSFRVDGLFLPKEEKCNLPFYLVEVQFQSDEDLYYRIFSELFLLIKQYKPKYPWRVVVIYPTRSIEKEETKQFNELLQSERVTRIYLDELENYGNDSLGIELVKLVVESTEQAIPKAQQLIKDAQSQLTNQEIQRNFLDLIETIIVYKLPHKTREEIGAMFSLSDLKKTKFYQEVYQEGEQSGEMKGKLNSIPRLAKLGLTKEQIAQALDLSLDLVEDVLSQN